MDQTAIQPGTPAPKLETAIAASLPTGSNGTVAEAPREKPAKKPVDPFYQALVWLADLRITVALFAFALLIVFWGTLAQKDFGVWTVVERYFRSFYILVPLRVVLFLGVEESGIVVPFPGGWLVGSLMLINLLAAHAIRFKFTWSRSGILLIHAGIIVMMLGELITGLYANEGQMIIPIGKSANTVVDARSCELAIIHTDPANPKKDDVVTIPSRLLKNGATIDDDRSPFRINVIQFMVNSALRDDANNRQASKGFGRFHLAVDVPEVSGVDPNQKLDTPSVYVKLSDRDGKELGTWLLSTRFEDPQWIKAGGKEYQVSLRYKQTTRDFTIFLKDFKHDVFPGTETAKDFHAYVRLIDAPNNVDRDDVEIWMNHPLYYRGETFYQSSWTTDQFNKANGTILQVVRNPGWLLPYISCAIVGFGMLIHFGITLYRFIDRRIVR